MRWVPTVAAALLFLCLCILALSYNHIVPPWDESHFILGAQQRTALAEQSGAKYYLVRTRAEVAAAFTRPDPKIIFADGETGPGVQFEYGPAMPATMALGAANDPDLTRRFGRWAGQGFRLLKIDSVLTPQADIFLADAPSVIGWRSFGGDPDMVARHTKAYVEGLLSAGVLPIVKHFPGHGLTPYDTHDTLGSTSASLAAIENHVKPFRLIAESAADFGVMIGHLTLGGDSAPGAASKYIMNKLRQDLGFNGLVVSDSVNMAPVKNMPGGEAEFSVKAIQNGADLILEPISPKSDYRALRTAKQAGTISPATLQESRDRLDQLQEKIKELRSIAPPGYAEWGGAGESLGWELLEKGCVAFGRGNEISHTTSTVVRVGDAVLSHEATAALETSLDSALSDLPEFNPDELPTTTPLLILYWSGGTGLNMDKPWTQQQMTWLKAARDLNTPVKVVVFGNPMAGFQLRSFENIQGFVSWGRSTLSCKAAAAWLAGNFTPKGEWPIE